MKKLQYSRYGGELRLDEAAMPNPGRGEVRVRVKAASYNPMDGKIRRGEMKALSGFRFPRGLGHDFAGVVDAAGPGVRRFKAGDEVLGVTSIPRAGAFAEFVLADETNVGLKPGALSFEQAAAMTIIGITAWNALIAGAKLKSGQSVFVNGCLGGVGRSAVQLARGIGAHIAGSCRASGMEDARALGVSEIVDYRAFEPSSWRGRFDVVFDTAGALSLRQCDAMLKSGGVSLHIVPTFAKMAGSLFSSRRRLVFGNPTPQGLAGVAEAARGGGLAPEISRVVALSEAAPAIAEVENGGVRGKLVVVAG